MSFWLAILVVIYSQPLYDPSVYQLGTNLIVNSMFNDPLLTGGALVIFVPNAILGWNCTGFCKVRDLYNSCFSFGQTCQQLGRQVIELDYGAFPEVSQSIVLTEAGQYLLHIEWVQPFNSPIGKEMTININSTSIANIIVGTSNFDYRV